MKFGRTKSSGKLVEKKDSRKSSLSVSHDAAKLQKSKKYLKESLSRKSGLKSSRSRSTNRKPKTMRPNSLGDVEKMAELAVLSRKLVLHGHIMPPPTVNGTLDSIEFNNIIG